ncbi:tetratricopeptide repeat protein [Streptomyces mirabilis]|uniref:tetratricopeptide repeat protein n=1 Tax=Streptomyces mirabilis TaxID=68239 RepID=UPI00369670DE
MALTFQRVGARDEYLQARELVADLLRPHCEREPLEFANALGVLAAALAEADRPDEAVARLQECRTLLAPQAAPEISTERLTADSDALDGLALYARALLDLGGCLGVLGSPEEAVSAHQQALAAFERCAAASLDFEPNVAVTSSRLADMLLEQPGGAEEALSAADRAVGILTARADFAPYREAVLPDLGYAHWLRTRALTRLDRLDDAVAAGRQAVTFLRVAAVSSVPHAWTLVTALELTSDLLADAQEHAEAQALAVEALEAADRTTEPFLQLLALWLHSRRLLDNSTAIGAWEDTRVVELLSAYSTLVENAPDPWLEELAVQLMHLSEHLVDVPRVADAAGAAALALTPYRRLVAADPGWTPAYCHALSVYTELCLRIGEADQALFVAEHYLAVASSYSETSAMHARAQETLSTCLARVGRQQEAEQAVRACVDLWATLAEADDGDLELRLGLARACNNFANRLLSLDRPEQAAAAATRATALWPADSVGRASALYFVGVSLARLNRHRQAAERFHQAIIVYDDHAPLAPHQETQLSDVLHNLVLSYARLDDHVEAFACARRASAILHRQWQADPTAHHAHLLRALQMLMECGSRSNDLPAAVEAARLRVTALETHPATDPAELALALGDLGGLQLQLDAAEDAVDSFTRSANAVPDDPSMRGMIHCRRALALHRCGRTKDAILLVRHAVDLLAPIEAEIDHPYLLWLAQLHHDLAAYLFADARPMEALGAIGRATALRERLAQADADLHTAPLISDLELTATLLDVLDRPEQARQTQARIKGLTG